jgi:hypothetical protein
LSNGHDARCIGNVHTKRSSGDGLDSLGLSQGRRFDGEDTLLFDEPSLFTARVSHLVTKANGFETK